MSVSCDTSQVAEKSTIDSSTESRSKKAFKVKDAMPASHCLIHSSRVSKSAGKRPTRLRRDGTKLSSITDRYRLIREDNLGTSSNSSTAGKQCSNLGMHHCGEAHGYPSRLRDFVLAVREKQLWRLWSEKVRYSISFIYSSISTSSRR